MKYTVLLLAALGACGDSSPAGAPDAPAAAPIDASVDTLPGTPVTCALPDGTGADALAFASPDTLLYTYTTNNGNTRWIGRQDGATAQPTWLEADTVIGKMIVVDRTLYFTDTAAVVWSVDLDAATPVATRTFTPTTDDDNTRYGLTADAAGTLYATVGYGGQERIWRHPTGGGWSEVTTSDFTAGPIGATVVAPDGSLLVVTLFGNQLWRISIGADGTETGRTQLTTVAGANGLDFGLELDETGALYVLSAGSDALTRLRPPAFTDEESAATFTGYLQGMAFGRGCWGTHDVYVAAGSSVVAVDVGATGTP